jgi:glucose-1-phosphate adenylyltransferase
MLIRSGRVLTVILAGGKGERLGPLTILRAKPAVPFGGIYRIIDMTLSNCVNSGLRRIFVLTQYMSRSLSRHLRESWRFISRPTLGEFVDPLPPQHKLPGDWYHGTADALHQNRGPIEAESPEIILVLAGDHIYKMDYSHMLAFHQEKKADMVIGAVEVPVAQAGAFGILEVDAEGRVIGFEEKPKNAKSIPGRPDLALASMGIYSFRPEPLFRELDEEAGDPTSSHDIGRDLVRRMMRQGRVFGFPFIDENKKGFKYWRDVGTVDAYWEANMDLVSVDPQLNLYDDQWPIHTMSVNAPPPKFVFAQEEPGGRLGVALDSLVSSGCIISGGRVQGCVLSPFVRVNSYSKVRDSILFDHVTIGRNCRVRKAIIDKGVHLPEGTVIGEDPDQDKKRWYVSPGGVVVIPKNGNGAGAKESVLDDSEG